MPLEPAAELLRFARRNGFAVGYFESWDIASMEGTIDAAERARAPIIVGFNGEFLARRERDPPARLEYYAAVARAAAEAARVPCAAMFNECPADDWVRRAIHAGFNLVMLADAAAPPDDMIRRVSELAREAHGHGVAIEGELGTLPAGVADHGDAVGSPTDPAAAAEFVAQTGIDVLAVSTGNVHVLLEGRRRLDLDRLAAIAGRVELPLALHGGTGIDAGSLRQAVTLGVAKVNFGTYLKQRVLAAWRQELMNQLNSNAVVPLLACPAVEPSRAVSTAGQASSGTRQTGPAKPQGGDADSPHHLLGDGQAGDLLVIARRAVREAVLERIDTLGCVGRA